MIKDIIIHDRTAPGPNTPDHPPALVPAPHFGCTFLDQTQQRSSTATLDC